MSAAVIAESRRPSHAAPAEEIPLEPLYLTERRAEVYVAVKQLLEGALAVALLVLTAPLLLLAALLVRLTSRGPILYTQRRLGRHGRPYTVYKIRTMTHDCERQSGPCWARRGDPRIFPVGRSTGVSRRRARLR